MSTVAPALDIYGRCTPPLRSWHANWVKLLVLVEKGQALCLPARKKATSRVLLALSQAAIKVEISAVVREEVRGRVIYVFFLFRSGRIERERRGGGFKAPPDLYVKLVLVTALM